MIRSRGCWIGAAVAAAVLFAQGASSAAPDKMSSFQERRQKAAAHRAPGAGPGGYPINVQRSGVQASAVGTITYDDGVGTTSFGGSAAGVIIGNRFNTRAGNPVLASGSVSQVQAVVVPGPALTTGSAGFVLLGPQTGGGGAMAIFSTFTTGLTGTAATVNFAGIGANYTGSSFFVLFGDFAGNYVPAFGSGTNLGQGFHGVAGVTGGMGPNITAAPSIGGLNALIRATGNNTVPVELMTFEVE